jgi:hypothetical protein
MDHRSLFLAVNFSANEPLNPPKQYENPIRSTEEYAIVPRKTLLSHPVAWSQKRFRDSLAATMTLAIALLEA